MQRRSQELAQSFGIDHTVLCVIRPKFTSYLFHISIDHRLMPYDNDTIFLLFNEHLLIKLR